MTIAPHPDVFIDIDNPPAAPIHMHVGQTLVLIRQSLVGGQFLHLADLPLSHFAHQAPVNHGLTPRAGQPAQTYIVAVGTATTSGSGNITVQFRPSHPAYPPYAPSTIPFVVA